MSLPNVRHLFPLRWSFFLLVSVPMLLPQFLYAEAGVIVAKKARNATFDPYDGMDPDGRIPKVDLPDDVTNPERWRYIPEGRIKPGNVLDRFLVSTFIVPVFFFEEDIGAGGGVAVTDIDFRGQRRREFAGTFLTYTSEGQQRFRMVWQRWMNHRELEGGGVILEERSFLRARGGYERTLTRRFFGFGPRTEASDETSYTEEITGVQLMLQQSVPRPGDDVIYQIGISGERHNLARGHVSDVPSTDAVYPGVVSSGDGHDMLWMEAILRYDTRDSQHAPYRGWTFETGVDVVPVQSRGGGAALYSLGGSWIAPLPGLLHAGGKGNEENPPTDVVALGAQMQWVDGSLPFWALPALGGKNTLRGYIENRFTGRASWHASGEYRFWAVPRGVAVTESIRIERIGAALFYDIGTVSDGLDTLWSEPIHDSYGISLRFSLERTAQFRADLGFSDEGTNFSFGYGLSF